MKIAALILAALFIAGVLWTAGELHRGNCIQSDRANCSPLPWDAGKPMVRTATAEAKRPVGVYCYRPDSGRPWLTSCIARSQLSLREKYDLYEGRKFFDQP